MTLVNHYCITIAIVLAEQFLIHLAETLAIHGFYVNISDASARDAIYKSTIAVNPTLVKQFFEFTRRYRFDDDVLFLTLHTDAYRFACLAVEQCIIVVASHNLHSINTLDDVAWLHSSLLHCKRSTLDYLLYLESVAFPFLVEEESE